MAMLKPSVNLFALLEGDDPGDTRLADVRAAPAKVQAAPPQPVNINKKQQQTQTSVWKANKPNRKQQQPQMSVWKANKLKAEADAIKQQQQQQQMMAASKAKANIARANAGKNWKPQQPAAPKAQVVGAAANAAKNKKPPTPPAPQQQQPAASRAPVKTAANAAITMDQLFEQPPPPPAPVSITELLFGGAYRSAWGLIYKNRKQNAGPADAKDGAPTDDKKGGHVDEAAAAAVKDAPAPVQEEPPAPVKPVLPPPPPSLNDAAQFPSLK